jgi:hypothetical protein
LSTRPPLDPQPTHRCGRAVVDPGCVNRQRAAADLVGEAARCERDGPRRAGHVSERVLRHVRRIMNVFHEGTSGLVAFELERDRHGLAVPVDDRYRPPFAVVVAQGSDPQVRLIGCRKGKNPQSSANNM